MQKYDLQTLGNQLNLLAEVYERKPVTLKALEVWFDTLKEFPTERILSVLIGWPKAHHKFPVPAEVWKACNEKSTDEREEKALAERAFYERTPPTAVGRMMAGRIREILKLPKRSPVEHWRNLLLTAPVGSVGHRFATEALEELDRRRGKVVEREPGQDDEELAA